MTAIRFKFTYIVYFVFNLHFYLFIVYAYFINRLPPLVVVSLGCKITSNIFSLALVILFLTYTLIDFIVSLNLFHKKIISPSC